MLRLSFHIWWQILTLNLVPRFLAVVLNVHYDNFMAVFMNEQNAAIVIYALNCSHVYCLLLIILDVYCNCYGSHHVILWFLTIYFNLYKCIMILIKFMTALSLMIQNLILFGIFRTKLLVSKWYLNEICSVIEACF